MGLAPILIQKANDKHLCPTLKNRGFGWGRSAESALHVTLLACCRSEVVMVVRHDRNPRLAHVLWVSDRWQGRGNTSLPKLQLCPTCYDLVRLCSFAMAQIPWFGRLVQKHLGAQIWLQTRPTCSTICFFVVDEERILEKYFFLLWSHRYI